MESGTVWSEMTGTVWSEMGGTVWSVIANLQGHYDPQNILAIDPHRIRSSTQRVMPKKKKRPSEPAHKPVLSLSKECYRLSSVTML